MNRRNLSLILLAALFLGFVPSFAAAEKLPGLNGGELKTDRLPDDAILVFWASWSPKCRDIVARINAVQKKWGSKARVISVVFQEDAADVRRFLKDEDKLSVPIYLDQNGAFSKKYHVTSLPGLLIFRGGQEVYRGKLPNDPASVIADALGG